MHVKEVLVIWQRTSLSSVVLPPSADRYLGRFYCERLGREFVAFTVRESAGSRKAVRSSGPQQRR
jgi:hypothetical protein